MYETTANVEIIYETILSSHVQSSIQSVFND